MSESGREPARPNMQIIRRGISQEEIPSLEKCLNTFVVACLIDFRRDVRRYVILNKKDEESDTHGV
jgi:hypothetical protein